MHRKVLIPIDGSEGSIKALEYCIKMLEDEVPEKVVLFHSVSYPSQLESYSGKMRGTMNKVKEQLEEHGQRLLKEAKDLIEGKNNNVSVDTKLSWGDPKYEIVEEADGGNYDLLIIGSRGLSGIKSFLLGSVGSHVAQNVKCTVILVKQ
ncbi:MAG: universal stress protein [Bacillota bacterium]